MNDHKHMLKEAAKFAAGLITADFLVGLWVLSSNYGPLNLFGISFTQPIVEAWMVFDAAVLILLVHYAWHVDVYTPSIKQKNLFILIGSITGVVGVAHLLRLIFGVSVDIGGWVAPFWLSWIGTMVALYVSYASFRFVQRPK